MVVGKALQLNLCQFCFVRIIEKTKIKRCFEPEWILQWHEYTYKIDTKLITKCLNQFLVYYLAH